MVAEKRRDKRWNEKRLLPCLRRGGSGLPLRLVLALVLVALTVSGGVTGVVVSDPPAVVSVILGTPAAPPPPVGDRAEAGEGTRGMSWTLCE